MGKLSILDMFDIDGLFQYNDFDVRLPPAKGFGSSKKRKSMNIKGGQEGKVCR